MENEAYMTMSAPVSRQSRTDISISDMPSLSF